jgi:flavodoxin
MKYIILLLFLFVFSSQDQIDTSKALIIYFTRTGNTELFANYIKEKMNIELFKIVPAYPYPEDNDEMSKVCQEEQSSNARPEIKDPLTDVSEYDTILLGTPIWYGHIPNIVMTQLEKLNLNGKTIYPFNTHGGSGVGSTVTDIKQYAIGANVKDGFPLLGTYVKDNKEGAMNDITNWLEKNFEIIINTNSASIDNTNIENSSIESTGDSNSSTESTSSDNSITDNLSTDNSSTNNTSSDTTNSNKDGPNDDEEEEEEIALFAFSEILKCKYFLVLALLSLM